MNDYLDDKAGFFFGITHTIVGITIVIALFGADNVIEFISNLFV